MARTAAPYTPHTVHGTAVDPSGVTSASGTGNGVQVAAARPELTVLRVANASGGSGTISVLAGTQPLAPSSGQGPLTVTVANSSTQWIGPFESARFIQSDGSLIAESSVALTVTAFKVNRH
jgi:hypothetical protein